MKKVFWIFHVIAFLFLVFSIIPFLVSDIHRTYFFVVKFIGNFLTILPGTIMLSYYGYYVC